jgi:hypothetical protein
MSALLVAALWCAGCDNAPPEPKESPGAMMDKSFNETGAKTPESK